MSSGTATTIWSWAKSTDTQSWRPACGAGAQVQDTAINLTRRQTRLRVALYQVVCPVERRLAERPRVTLPESIAHADRGSQYTSNDYLDYCQRHQLRPSVGRVATCVDNAVASRSGRH